MGYLGSDRKSQIVRLGVVLSTLTTMLIKPLYTKKMMMGRKGARMELDTARLETLSEGPKSR